MRKKIGLLVLDLAAAAISAFGIGILLLPLALHLWLGADNDAYLEIAEWAGGKPNTLVHLSLGRMFRPGFVLWPALLVITGLVLRMLLWRWSPIASPFQSERKSEQ